MAQKKFKLRRAALREILKSEPVELELFRRAEAIREACDPDGHLGEDAYVAVSGTGRNRARASVIAVTAHARNSNAKHNTLIKALDAGKDAS
jgi:hypothetical protein